MMSGIRGQNTRPELIVRKGLHALGFRYRLHSTGLPGKPDIVLKKYRAAIFVNGCFWHGHDCHLFRMPSTRPDFWRQKIERNMERDQEVKDALGQRGWRQMIVWECALKGKTRLDFERTMQSISDWLTSQHQFGEIAGRHD